MKRLFLSILAIFCFQALYSQEIKLSDHLYAIVNNKGGNVAVCICPDEVILVDDQMASSAHVLDSIISTITDQEVGTIINTHYHFDHVDGNKHYGKKNARIVSHHNARKRMAAEQVFWVPPNKQEALPAYALPNITFTDSLTIHKPNETIQIYHVKNAHSDGDVFVKFKNANVLHTGDIMMTFGIPFIDGDNGGNLYGLIAALSRFIECSDDSTKVIPGHGQISTRDDLIEYRKVIATIEERIRNGIQDGLSMEEIIENDPYKDLEVGFSKYFDLEYAYFNVKESLEIH